MRELADIDYEDIKHETKKAWLFVINGEDKWIPKSIAEVDEDAKQVTVPMKFAVEEGLV